MDTLLPVDMAELAEKVVRANQAVGRTIALAESCTGGLVAAALTEVAGSSAVFERGFVTYSNDAKMQNLNVASDIIETFGAVSVACAWAMAQGALENSKADIAISISGVAGPDGGTDLKPVGTVVFSRAIRGSESKCEGEMKQFGQHLSRAEIRRQATLCALELLLP